MALPAGERPVTSPSRSRRWLIGGWALVAVLLVIVVKGVAKHAVFNPTDMVTWQGDWHAFTGCLAQHDVAPCHGVSKFPLAYLFNAWLSDGGASQRLLTLVNTVGLLLPLAALGLIRGIREAATQGWPYLAAILLSPLPAFYVASGALEIQSAVFCGLYMGAFVRCLASPGLRIETPTAWVLVLSGCIFPLYKDTIAVLMGSAIVVLLIAQRDAWWPLLRASEDRRRVFRLFFLAALPVLLAQSLTAAYSWFKYGVPLPLAYMDEAAQASPGYAKSAEFLFGSLFSPNGGAVVFWALPIGVAMMGWRLAGWFPRRQAFVVGGVLFAVCSLAFARWWAPFGWDSWGDRLLIPPVLAALVAGLMCLRPLEGGARVSFGAAFAGCLPVLVWSAYYIAVPYKTPAGEAIPRSLWSGKACERMRDVMPTDAVSQGLVFWKGETYYRCARERMLHVPGPTY